MTRSNLRRRGLVLSVPGWWMTGCRRQLSPEDRIRRELIALETAIEEKDFSRVREGLSARFRGPEEMDRGAAMALLQLRLRARPQLHLLVRVAHLEMTTAAEGRVELRVAMASFPVSGPEGLRQLDADLLRLDLRFTEEEGRFRVFGASWGPARLDEFF